MISEPIKAEMKEQKVNQTTLSEKTGITKSILSNFLNNKTSISTTSLAKIMKVLQLRITK